MTKKTKKIIFILISIIILVILIIIIVNATRREEKLNNSNEIVESEEKYVMQLTNDTKLNKSEELNKIHTYKDIEISAIQFTSQNGNSVLLADVKNTGKKEFTAEEVIIVLIGENNEEKRKIAVYIPNLAAGETKQINSIVTADVINVKDFKIESTK